MILQEKFRNETGIDATYEIQLYEGESSVIYEDDYVKWLEGKVLPHKYMDGKVEE